MAYNREAGNRPLHTLSIDLGQRYNGNSITQGRLSLRTNSNEFTWEKNKLLALPHTIYKDEFEMGQEINAQTKAMNVLDGN